jgi:hypothetical protein
MSDEINHNRRRFLGTTAMTIAAARLGMIDFANAQSSKTLAAVRLSIEGELPSFGGATE